MATQRKQSRKSAAVVIKKANSRQRSSSAVLGTQGSGADTLLVREIRQKFGVNRQVFSRLSQFSERAIAKWESGEPLSPPSKQRMAELRRLQRALAGVMRPDFISKWMLTPNEAFEGLKPLEVVERGEIDRLWRMIHLMESGVPT